MMLFAVFIVLNISIVAMNTQSSTDKMDIEDLTVSCNNFAENFFKELSMTSGENIITSPLSVHMILSLLSHGAESDMLDDFINGLHHRQSELIKEQYSSLLDILQEMENVKLYIASAIYIQEGFELLTEFLTIGTNVYKSHVSRINFSQNIDAAKEINTWVTEITNNKITDLTSSEDFSEDTQLVLLNAIYFTGKWLNKFDPEDTDRNLFYVAKNQKKLVPTMFNKSKYNIGNIREWDATFIELPYMNEDIVMTIILPTEVDGLSKLENNFSWEVLAKALKSKVDIELYLPKFKTDFIVDLKSVLCQLGLSKMFEDIANFSRICDAPLKVSKVVHKAVIEVNEAGTEAAAATGVQVRLRRMAEEPEQFVVDRPFMFVIELKSSNIPLFVGTIKDINTISERDEL